MAVSSGNPKHVFDFEGILNMDIDPAHWKKVKKQIEDAFGNLKIAIQEGLAEEEAQKYVDQFNKIFRKAKLPEIGLDELREDFAKLEVNVEKAVAAINNINLDRLDDVIHELKIINGEVEKIAKNKGGIKLFGDDFKKIVGDIERIAQAVAKTTNPFIKSISEIDDAIDRAKVSAQDIQDALNFTPGIKKDKINKEIKALYDDYKNLGSETSWEEEYTWFVKFNKAYEAYVSKLGKGEKPDTLYAELYGKHKGGDSDMRNMLQNILNRNEGKALVGYQKEPWALENTLQEIKNILQGGLNVNVEGGEKVKPDKGDKAQPKEFKGGENLAQEKTLKNISSLLQKIYDATSKGVYENVGAITKEYDKAINSLTGSQATDTKVVNALRDEYLEKFMSAFPTKDLDNLERSSEIKDVFKSFSRGDLDLSEFQSQLRLIINNTLDKVLIDFSEDAAMQLQDAFESGNQSSDAKEIVKTEDGAVTIDPNALANALGKMQVTADNKDVVDELKLAEQSLGTLVAQDETLKSLKDAIGNITVTPDNSEVVNGLKTLAQNLLNLAQEDTLQAIKNDGQRLTREDITQAVKEGMYAKEFAGKYRDAMGLDVIDPQIDGFYNKITGTLHESYDEARAEFDQFIKGRYVVPRDKDFLDLKKDDFEDKSDVLNRIIENDVVDQGNWAQVIVEAIQDQTGKITEVVKLRVPPEVTDNVGDAKLIDAFEILTQAIEKFSNYSNKAASFFDALANGKIPMSGDLGDALQTLGLVSSSGTPKFKLDSIGGLNRGVAIGKDVVYHATRKDQVGSLPDLMAKQNRAHEAGAAVARIIAADIQDDLAFQLQTKVAGNNLRTEEGVNFVNASPEQIDRLLYTLEILEKEGLVAEFRGDNVMYDEKEGFSIIDLSSEKIPGHNQDSTTAAQMLKEILNHGMANWRISDSDLNKFRDQVKARAALPAEDRLVNADTIAAEKRARERAAAQAAARQKNAKEINVVTDNSDVVEAINKLGQNLGTLVAQEDTLQAIKDGSGGITKEDVVTAIKEGTTSLTKEDVVAAIKEGVPALKEETANNDAPWALESTLGEVKSVLDKIQANTSNLNGVEIRQAVDENTQAAQQAAGTVATQMDDVATSSDLDKIIRKQLMTPDGAKTVAQTQIHNERTDDAFRTVKDQFVPDEEGEFQLVFREVIDDLDKLRKANKKDAEAVIRAQKKVNEFLAKFESKTGGNAKFVEGFSGLKSDVANEGFINKDNIDEVYNRMLELQRRYAELETNFRKGQSSLNPFVNAINKAQNIGNIFGAVEIKFNGLVEKSEELTTQFTKLRTLSESIKQFTDRMANDPDSITPADFTEFSKQMGEFTATKAQVDGLLKNEAKLNKEIVADQKARIKEWVKLSKQLGVLDAKINSGLFDEATVEQAKKEADLVQKKIDAVLAQIREPSDHLVTVGDANIAAENKTINAQMSKRIGELAGKYEQLGKLQARAEKAGAITDRDKYEQLKAEIEAESQTLRLNEEQNEGLLRALQLHQETAYANEKDLTIAKERKRLFNEWIELVKQISALDAQIESGLFDEVAVNNAKMARDGLSKQIDAILPQLDLTREDYIFAGQESMKSEQATVTAQRQKLFKGLAEDYAKLGEAQAQADVKGTDAAKEHVAQLSREIASKKEILNLSEDELQILETISEQSRAENAGLLNAKDRDKAARAELQSQKKLSKRQALVGKAGSAIGRADSTWLEATALDRNAMPPEFLARVKDYEKKLDALKIKHNELSNSPGPISDKQKKDLIAQTQRINKLTDEIGGLIDEYQRLSGANALEIGATGLNGKSSLDEYKKELTSAVMAATNGKAQIKGFNWETKTLNYTVKTGAHEFTEYTAAVRGLDHQMVSLRGNTKRTETFLEATKRKMSEISSYMSGMAVFSRASQEIKKGIQYVREIDLALTELKKVTDETDESYDKFLKTAAKTGARLGTTISAVTEATATFSKLGYEMEMATEMAEAAIVYKNVGDNIASTEDAADSIISTLKGFKLEASEAMAIVDRFNEVGNRFAITSQGIGEALRLSASALNEGGNSLDESIAMITAANEVVNDPSSVGTALKTLTLRLRGSKTELEEMGEDVSDMATTTSQLQAKLLALTGGQVDIMADANTFKNSTQILREMAAAWEDMTDIQRASALELMGGKRQANVLSALIQNFDTVESVIETSANSAGSALRENEKYLDSIQGKIDQFNNATQAMWSDTLNSDTVKNFVELATTLVKILDAIGPLNVAFIGLVTFLEKKYGIFSDIFKPAEEGLEALKKQLVKAEQDLAKAEATDLRKGTAKTADKRRNAEERVNILRQKVQEASAEAVLEGIDDAFDPVKAKNSLNGKKGARAKRAKKLQAEGKTFAEIEADPKVQQYTKEIEEAEQALNSYNAAAQRTNATMQQSSATTRDNTNANRENTTSNIQSAAAENTDTIATQANTDADILATMASDGKVAATWKDVLATAMSKDATLADIAAKIKQLLITKLLTTEYIKQKIANGDLTVAQMANMSMTKLLGLGFKGLMTSIWGATKAMFAFLFTNPVGWLILATAAVIGAIAAWNKWGPTLENLTEKLNDFKSKLSNIESELDSVNSELEATNERMAELLAKDKLTFEEQEELDRLKETNNELERRKELLEDEKKYKEGLVGRQAARVVDSAKSDKDWWESQWLLGGGVVGGIAQLFGGWNDEGEEAENNIEDYRKLKEKYDNATSLKDKEKYQKKLDKEAEKIDEYIATLSEALDGVEYGDSEESDAALDYLAELQDNYGIARGSAGAKTNAIKGILNKDEFSDMSDAIDYYVELLKDGDESASESIAGIINDNEDLIDDLEARGLEAQDAIDYFTKLADTARFDTIEGKTEELRKATEKLPDAFNDIGQFMDGDEVDKTAIAEYFKGTSDKTREEIAKLIQDINDGKIDVKHALEKFELFGVQSVLEIEITEVQTNFKDTFTDLENADGLIDTFQELADAIGSTSNALDALNAAQAEMEASGRVSIETALKLMEYTDDYSKVLTISEGKLILNEDAEENLIEARIENMKASALKALEDAKAARETTVLAKSNAEAALSTYNSAMETEISAAVTASAWDKVLAAAAGLLAGIQSLFTDESWTEAYDRAYQEVLSSRGENRVAEVNAKYATAEEQARKAKLEKDIEDANKAIEEQDKEIEKLQGNSDLINGLTKDNIGDVFKSDGFDNPDEVKDDRFQKEMDYWENRIAANQAKRNQIQNEIDLLEAKGMRAGEEYYSELIALEEERKSMLIAQRNEALAYLSTQEEGSEEWWNAAKIVNDLEGEIDDATASIQDYADAQAQIKWDNLEEITKRFSDLHDEIADLRDILQREDMFDEDGNWTEAGAAVLGTYVHDLETYKNELATLQSEIADLQAHPYNEANAAYLKETYSIDSEQEYNDLVTQWNQAQRDIVKGAYDTADAIKDAYSQQVDAIEDAINEQIDAYNDYIDVVKEAYDAERELYEFKKDIQKQSKSIAETERRIASLSGSTNAADIAERRKLEAQLAEQREGINDSYYNHANDQRSNALDNEAQAYEESMNRYVEGLRETLEEQAQGLITFTETGAMVTNEFLNGVTATVLENAGIILNKYEEVSPYMSNELKQPWIDASAQLGQHGNDLSVLNAWTSDSGYFGKFKTTASGQITTPFVNGSAAASAFQTSTTNAMNTIASNVRSNVSNITSSLGSVKSAYSGIITTANQAKAAIDAANAAAAAGASYTGTAANPQSTVVAPQQVDSRILSKYKLTSDQVLALGYGPISLEKFEDLLKNYLIKYSNKFSKAQVWKTTSFERSIGDFGANYVSGPWAIRQYAKGTMGTTRDEWALTDEPQFGDELVLIPGKDGNLSFMRKGTGVVPADLTQKLVELAQIPATDLMRKNITAIVPDITKNDIKNEFNFDSLVHVDHCDQNTLKDLEKMVDNKIDKFSKDLNYSIKRFTR